MEKKKKTHQELETHQCLESHSVSLVVVVIEGARCDALNMLRGGGHVKMVVVESRWWWSWWW